MTLVLANATKFMVYGQGQVKGEACCLVLDQPACLHLGGAQTKPKADSPYICLGEQELSITQQEEQEMLD